MKTEQLVLNFPKFSRRLHLDVVAAYSYVCRNYKAIQMKLIEKHINPRSLDELRQTFKRSDCTTSLYLHLVRKEPVQHCPTCNKITEYRSTNRKFLQFCSPKCSSSHVIEARKRTWLQKYGVDNCSKLPEVRRRISKGVKRYNKSMGYTATIGKERRRSFNAPSLPPNLSRSLEFYVYAILDTRKPGRFKYGHFVFNYEPFYIGKGRGNRAYSHLKSFDMPESVAGQRSRNSHKKSKIKKIIEETGDWPEICIKRSGLTEREAFILEARLIHSIGRSDLKLGPLTNHSDGGEGSTGAKWSRKARKEQSARVRAYFERINNSH